MKKLIATAVLATVSATVFAFGLDGVKQSIPLKEGSTVHVFENGKMAMEDKFGRAVYMADGEVMETNDGQKITMHGNEVARLYLLLNDDYHN
ncbi:CopK family periplasmic copper-binding protein [Massilia putida]|uniref:CopK family periplasmic copper-binding protein n=1 Tax=Massilia putida TaxID=1141883 RepID=UPI0009515D17|nr:CopK family periplasmic copper-binding protein [Massilia putida]